MYTHIFTLHTNLLKAMSHPKRLEIIHLLRDQTLSVTQMLEMLDLPQANLSQHLMILRKAGVVTTKKEGKQIFYSLTHENFVKTSDLIREILIGSQKNSKIGKDLQIDMSDLFPLVHDPVCKMRLSPKTAAFSHDHQNKEYFFCASGCLEKFKKNPNQYLKNNIGTI